MIDVSYKAEHLYLRDVALRLFKGRWWVLGCICCGLLGGVGAAFHLRLEYKASVVVMPVEHHELGIGAGGALGGLGGLASLAGINVGSSNSRTYEGLAVLQSREFIERYVSGNDLLPKLFPKKWDAERRIWKVSGEDIPTLNDAWKLFHKRILSVAEDDKTGLITITVTWTDRVEGANWANGLISDLNQEMRVRATQSSTEDLGYLESELASTRVVELRDSVESLMQSEEQERMLATVNRDYVFRIVDKAIPADARDPVIGRKTVLYAGLMIGLLVGLLGALFDWL